MRLNDSRHFLPMSSVLFRNTQVNLREQEPPSDNRTLANLSDRPDTAVTALPQLAPDIVVDMPHLGMADVASNAGNPDKTTQASNKRGRKATKAIKKAFTIKKSARARNPPNSEKRTWGHLFSKLKVDGAFWKKKKQSPVVESVYRPCVIGQPYNFQHLDSQGGQEMRSPLARRHSVQVREPGPRRGSVPVWNKVPGAKVDVEGTAFEEGDGDSEWEDVEETRIFRQHN